MAEESQSLQQTYQEAERDRVALESSFEFNSDRAQTTLARAIAKYKQSLRLAADIALFSPNEELEDVSSADLQFLLTNYWIADLTLRLLAGDRGDTLRLAARNFEAYLSTLDNYNILSSEDTRTNERYRESPKSFSIAPRGDAALQRQTKIAKFKEEKALKDKLDYLRRNPVALQNDDSLLRSLNLTHITLRTQQTFQHLESIARELEMLSLAPDPTTDLAQQHARAQDERARSRDQNGNYSDRVDPPLSELLRNGRGGPILAPDGKPLRPFTLLDTRTRMQQGVFRPDHSLPTMTIDEYLEEEKRRGGMIDGGGPQSQVKEQEDEDDMDKADEATMKARAWDEYVEANPKGAGNRMNNG